MPFSMFVDMVAKDAEPAHLLTEQRRKKLQKCTNPFHLFDRGNQTCSTTVAAEQTAREAEHPVSSMANELLLRFRETTKDLLKDER